MTNLNKYENFILESLEDNNVQVSNELCQLLESSFNVSNSYARKIIQRATKKGIIKSSKPLTLGKGQYAYCRKNINFTKKIIDSLKLPDKNKRHYFYDEKNKWS